MRTIWEAFNTAWLGTVIGLIGIVLAIIFYQRAKLAARLAYQARSTRLIGGSTSALPAEVQVTVKGSVVPRLTKATLVLWNHGNLTVRGEDIVAGDPLRVVVEPDGQIIDARIVRLVRAVNALQVQVSDKPNEATVGFDFLDPSDGCRIEVLHTSATGGPTIRGTVRGVRGGVEDMGRLPLPERGMIVTSKNPLASAFDIVFRRTRLFAAITVVLGLVLVLAGLVPDAYLYFFPKLGTARESKPLLQPGRVNWAFLLLGIMYLLPGFSLLWMRRRRFPKNLTDDQPETSDGSAV